MPDWTKLRSAYRAGLPNETRLEELQRLEKLLDLPPEQAKAAFQKEIEATPAQDLYRNLVVLNFAIQRSAGITPGPDANIQLQKLVQEVQGGQAAPEGVAIANRLFILWEAAGEITQRDSSVAQGPSSGELGKTKVMQSALAIFARLDKVEGQTGPGGVTVSSIEQLQSVLADAQALIRETDSKNEALPYVFYMTGSTARMLAGCYALAGRNEDALNAYADAAGYFEQAGEVPQVEDCKNRARDLQQKLTGDLDAAVAAALARLNATGKQEDPLERVKPLMQLVDVASSAGDTFEAQQNARAAARALIELGYPNPLECGLAEAVDTWIDKAAVALRGVPLLGRLSQIGTWYDSIAGAEFAVAVAEDKSESDRIYAMQCELHKMIAQFAREAKAAAAEQNVLMKRYFPDAAAKDEPAKDDFSEFLEKCTAIDNALFAIRQSCNQRAGTGGGMDDLLAQLHALQAQADGLNSPEYEAKTRLEEVYVLGHLGRSAEMIPIAQEARRRLLAGRADRIGSLAQSHQRYLYLDSRARELQARMMSGDLEGGLAMAESTIRDFETERYRVQDEFRQAALLSYVVDFYKWAALGAFKAKKWDSMLAAIDLIKARSAIRTYLTPRQDGSVNSDIARQFREVSDELAAADEPAKKQLEDKRRQLWELLSVSQAASADGAKFPELSVQALQSALSSQDVFISYFWLNETVLLTVVIDSVNFHAERIILKPAEAERLQAFIECVRTLRGPQLSMDKAVAKLGEILLPEFARELMRGKKRVIFSPHHSLHLFPFHAARWEQGFVGTEFAVSYTPNFSSLLLPWNKRSEDRMLAIGISRFTDPSVPALRNVEADVQTIRGYYEAAGTKVDVLLGPEASRARIGSLRDTGELSKFRCLHLGTHGRSVFETPNEPLESSLQLQNGRFDAMDIANLQLSADLVVLSACNSGQRAIQLRNLGEAPGDDIFGLQSALFKAGARSILGSLWIVQVDSASLITREFHRHYAAGERADFALQKSLKAYLENGSVAHQVFYWAPFFISSLGIRREERKLGDRTTNAPL
ncbi:MAG TPA: CHAT domain-containing protein [Bryobacteraceae bacterium]|jgi:CHAT domain-containing protein|nr:CHAT domain-containing protein [Bryobacteraceae bacterium]